MRPTFEELTMYREGEVTQARAAEIDRELAGSDELRGELARVDQLIAALKQPDPALETIDLRPAIAEAAARPVAAGSNRRRWLAGAATLAAAALLAVIFVPRVSEFGVKGGAFVPGGLELFVREGETVRRAPQSIAPDAALGFAYRNVSPSPYKWLMIYGVTSSGDVVWFYPAWTDAQTDPTSIAITSGASPVELPEAVQHQLPGGPLVIHGLFTARPWSVKEVEGSLKAGFGSDALDVTYPLSVGR